MNIDHDKPPQRDEYIFLVHHDAALRQQLKTVLKAAGFRHVVVTDTARAVINKLRTGLCNLLITSVTLPDSDAWTLAQVVHSGRFCEKSLPILVIGEGKPTPVTQCKAHDYHVPLFYFHDPEEVPKALDECLAGTLKPSLLVIEDDEGSAESAKRSLFHLFNIEITSDGVSGLAAYQARRHDLVLLDLRLPGIPGERLFQEIHKIDPKQPIIVITAYASLEAHTSFMLDNAKGFIPKPIEDINYLRETCKSALRERYVDALGAVLNDVGRRVYTADHVLSAGQTGPASRHLKSAIETCRDTILEDLTDEEWQALLEEF
jgi:DNA-binding NtrC family response regulator